MIASIDATARMTLIYLNSTVLTHATLAKGSVLQTSPALGLFSVARLGVSFGGRSRGLWWAGTQTHFCVVLKAFDFPLKRKEGRESEETA